MNVYRHFKNPLEAKTLFLRLGTSNHESGRLWEALMGWVDEDYPGIWNDWWEKHRDELEDLDRLPAQPQRGA